MTPLYGQHLSVDRRVSAHGLAALLGAWQHAGPAYAALADGVRLCLLNGSLPVGTRLPGERDLAEVLGVSRTTTTGAYRKLREQGFLASRQGSGSVTTLPTRRPAPQVQAPQDQDDVIDLTMAAPAAPAELYPAYQRALEELPPLLAGRGYDPFGLPVLRRAVAADYVRRGSPTTEHEVLITSGAQHAAHTVISALISPGDRVVVEHPTYPNVLSAIRACGGRPVPVPIGPDGLDVDQLESTVRQVAPRLIYLIPDYQNPTGTSLSAEARERVREIARRHRTVLVGDETLTGVVLDGHAPPSFAGSGRAEAGVVTIGSVSKTFWGGLRIGWVRSHPDLIARLASARYATDLSSAVLEQLVSAELLQDGNVLTAQRRDQLRELRGLLCALLAERLPDWQTTPPAGGLGCWVDLGAPVSSSLAAVALNHGVRITPGPTFGVDGSFESHVRLPYTTSPQDLDRATTALQAAWFALGPRVGTDARRAALPV